MAKHNEMADRLNVAERGDFRKAEATIEEGQATFVAVGNALLSIRNGRWYRETHKTFESYCKERWGIERNYANKLIAGTKVAKSLGTIVPKPTTEGQARELGRVPPEKRGAVMGWAEEKADGKPVTAKAIREAAVEVMEGEPEEEEEENQEEVARKTIGGWADTVGRFLSRSPSVDDYRGKWPSKQADAALAAVKQCYESLKAWQKVVK